MKNKPFIEAFVNDLTVQFSKGEISFSRMVELLNERVIDWLSSQPQEDKWVSVEEESPKDELVVLAWVEVMENIGLRTLAYKLGKLWYNGVKPIKGKVTHFQLLPSPPKVASTKEKGENEKMDRENKAWDNYRQAIYDATPKEICKCNTPKPMNFPTEPDFCGGCGNLLIKEKGGESE